MFKVLRALTLIFIMLVSSNLAFAYGSIEMDWIDSQETEAVFTDVNKGDWYYDAIMTMNRYEVISGYGDNTFRPLNAVSREEFAAMMVRALKLELKQSKSSFADISDDYWASPYIESAKHYITGYKLNDAYFFKPKEDAVREDMAVSLVRALNKSVDGLSSVGLDGYADKNLVSKNLYNYVASAIYNKLMIGYLEEDVKLFKPMHTLTRAQAAALLLSVVEEEKIVFETPDQMIMKVNVVDGGIKLDWKVSSEKEIINYKVIASKNSDNPQYPLKGYAKVIDLRSTIIYNGDVYRNGDFREFMPESDYYFRAIAFTENGAIKSNVLKVKMPKAISREGKVPKVSASQLGEGILLEWDEITTTGLQGYKIIASKSDKPLLYPQSGYAEWITDLSANAYFIEPNSKYIGGDFGESFKAGESYYLSVVAVYYSGKITGNTVAYTMPGDLETDIIRSNRSPLVSVEVIKDQLKVKWHDLPKDNLEGYKIVASINNKNPSYPEDGYAFFITDLNVYSKMLAAGTRYSGGDIEGMLIGGKEYYISVTAVYKDENVSGNAVLAQIPK